MEQHPRAGQNFVELVWGVDMALSGGDWCYDEIGVGGSDLSY